MVVDRVAYVRTRRSTMDLIAAVLKDNNIKVKECDEETVAKCLNPLEKHSVSQKDIRYNVDAFILDKSLNDFSFPPKKKGILPRILSKVWSN
jgi:hypothetical protein